MISGPAGQTKYGSIESLDIRGYEVGPVLTWDSKITTVVSMLGGFKDAVAKKMKTQRIYNSFLSKITDEWSTKFLNIATPNVPFATPNTQILHSRSDFTTCLKNY